MKIGLAGTMSVGKTTLAKALGELDQFKDHNVQTERSKYLRDLGIPLNTDSTLKGQTIFLAERCSELMRENVITDRTVIDVIALEDEIALLAQLAVPNNEPVTPPTVIMFVVVAPISVTFCKLALMSCNI